mgnify:CR=1 FL=1
MNRHLYVHKHKYKQKSDVYMLFVVLITVMGLLTFLTFIIPEAGLASDLPYEISRTP